MFPSSTQISKTPYIAFMFFSEYVPIPICSVLPPESTGGEKKKLNGTEGCIKIYINPLIEICTT